MKFFKALVTIALVVASPVAAKKKTKEEEEQALRDLQIGMAGLKEATQNPALLAQLMQDLQDPEMMKEAQKMMEDPAFKEQMKKMTGDKEFKNSVKKANEKMKDPSAAAEMEARAEHMARVGNDQLKKGAAEAMEEAMASMANPEVMAEMAKMMKDPNFQEQIAAMSKDPSFKNYVAAMDDMMKDPEKRQRVEKASDAFRNAM